MNSAASLAAGLPVGRRAVRIGVLAAYALPAVTVWALLGLGLGAIELPLPGLRLVALAAAAVYGGYYGVVEISGRRGLSPPGRRWQVPQTMLIDAVPRRRIVVWGALLGPGFATRNPFAGFGLLPLVLAAMPGIGRGLALGAAIGLAHGAARAMALVRDVHEFSDVLAVPTVPVFPAFPAFPAIPAAVTAGMDGAIGAAAALTVTEASAGEAAPETLPTHLDMVLKTIYWRRFDGAVLLAAAATAIAGCLRSFT